MERDEHLQKSHSFPQSIGKIDKMNYFLELPLFIPLTIEGVFI